MKRFACALLLLIAVPMTADVLGRFSATARRVQSLAGAPSTCAIGDVYADSGTGIYYDCTAANTWTAHGSGGGSAPFSDATALVKNSADATKLFKISASGLTTGTTVTMTPPTTSFTAARTDAAQTFTGVQTFSSPPTSPGAGANSEHFGSGATTGTAVRATAIGALATIADGGDDSVAVGYNNSVGGSNTKSVLIGSGNTGNGLSNIVIGSGNTAGNWGALIFGDSVSAGGNYRAFIGGASNSHKTDIWFGYGLSVDSGVTAGDLILHTSDGNGTNITAPALRLKPGAGTGTGPGGHYIVTTTLNTAGSGTTLNTATGDRDYISAGMKTLTESSATGVVDIAIPTGTIAGGKFLYTIEANDGTDFQSRRGWVDFSAVNKTGTPTSAIGTATEVVAVSTGTLTNTPTITNAAGKITINLNAVSSLTQTVLRVTWRLILDGGTPTVTPL